MVAGWLGVWLNVAEFLREASNPFRAHLRVCDRLKAAEIRGDGHCQLRYVDG
jgi:hypothetical protein